MRTNAVTFATLKKFLSGLLLSYPVMANAQLAVTVSPVKVTGQKAIIPLAMKNDFADMVESARAVVFLLDDQGKMVGQATKWVIGGPDDKRGLAPGATNAFFFVIGTGKGIASTNLTPKLSFSRIVLDGGKIMAGTNDVKITIISQP